MSAEARLFWRRMERMEVSPSGCWLWGAGISGFGYGRIGTRAGTTVRTWQAHRLAYQEMVGCIPAGLTLDHLCRVKRCVNPDHLEPVTIAENVARAPFNQERIARAKSHCAHGHLFTDENTHTNRAGRRICRACLRARSRNNRALAKPTSAEKDGAS